MNNKGKTSTIFLIVIAVLLLSLTIISFFFFKNESELRKAAEAKLAQVRASEVKLDAELKETKKQVFLTEEKNKEADEKINSLMDELELQEGLREQMKTENASLKEALTKESQDKEALHTELVVAQEKAASLEEKLKVEESQRTELEGKVKTTEESPEQANQSPPPGVELEKIVVTPDEIPQGKIVSVNTDNDFVIFNLGQEYGIAQNMLLSVYRGNKYLGDLKVVRVQEGMSVADFVPPLNKKQVKKDDKVVVKK